MVIETIPLHVETGTDTATHDQEGSGLIRSSNWLLLQCWDNFKKYDF